MVAVAVAVAVVAAGSDDGDGDENAAVSTRSRPTTTTTERRRAAVEDLESIIRPGEVAMTLAGSEVVPASNGIDLGGAPYLCVTMTATNVGTVDAGVDLTELVAVNPLGQIKQSSPAGITEAGIAGELGVQLAPGGTGTVRTCFDTDQLTGQFTVEYRPYGETEQRWVVPV